MTQLTTAYNQGQTIAKETVLPGLDLSSKPIWSSGIPFSLRVDPQVFQGDLERDPDLILEAQSSSNLGNAIEA